VCVRESDDDVVAFGVTAYMVLAPLSHTHTEHIHSLTHTHNTLSLSHDDVDGHNLNATPSTGGVDQRGRQLAARFPPVLPKPMAFSLYIYIYIYLFIYI